MIAGIVTPRPKAIDSPAEPAVCTMLFSRIVASRIPNFDRSRKIVMEITATGMDALTVTPTFSARYSDDAPKIMPRYGADDKRQRRELGDLCVSGNVGFEHRCVGKGIRPRRRRRDDRLLREGLCHLFATILQEPDVHRTIWRISQSRTTIRRGWP